MLHVQFIPALKFSHLFFCRRPLPFGGSPLETYPWTSGESNHHQHSVRVAKNNALPTEPRGHLVKLIHLGMKWATRDRAEWRTNTGHHSVGQAKQPNPKKNINQKTSKLNKQNRCPRGSVGRAWFLATRTDCRSFDLPLVYG